MTNTPNLIDALGEDILDMSDEEVLQECRYLGLNPAEEAERVRKLIAEAIAKAEIIRVLRAALAFAEDELEMRGDEDTMYDKQAAPLIERLTAVLASLQTVRAG